MVVCKIGYKLFPFLCLLFILTSFYISSRAWLKVQIWVPVGLGAGVSNLPMSSPGLPWAGKRVKKIEVSGVSPHKNTNHQTRTPRRFIIWLPPKGIISKYHHIGGYVFKHEFWENIWIFSSPWLMNETIAYTKQVNIRKQFMPSSLSYLVRSQGSLGTLVMTIIP